MAQEKIHYSRRDIKTQSHLWSNLFKLLLNSENTSSFINRPIQNLVAYDASIRQYSLFVMVFQRGIEQLSEYLGF
jgi:hypothetical protein